MAANKEESRMVSVAEATEQVRILARRLALMYLHFAEAIIEELGEEKGRELISRAVWRYGTECGLGVRDKVSKMGLPLTAENFAKGGDLPKYGWEREEIVEDGEPRAKVTYCPLAQVWMERGAGSLGRLYCTVDQAKYEAYNCLLCTHVRNVLDGDGCCVMSVREK